MFQHHLTELCVGSLSGRSQTGNAQGAAGPGGATTQVAKQPAAKGSTAACTQVSWPTSEGPGVTSCGATMADNPERLLQSLMDGQSEVEGSWV